MTKNSAFNQPVSELIIRRYSCRSFDGRGLEPGQAAALEKFSAGLGLPFKNDVRFRLIDNDRVRAESFFSGGSYGLIKGARFYLGALVKKDLPRCWEDVGFGLEALVLYATSLDLASCWIGGVFDRRRFGRSLGMRPGEILPAVVAVGRPAGRRSLRDRLARWSARGDRRKDAAEIFFRDDWQTPLGVGDFPRWLPVLEGVRLGPSASNKQPWRVVVKDGGFHFFLSRHRAYSAMMPIADLQRIDLGIAMCHFQLGAGEAGLGGEWQDAEPKILNTPNNYEYVISFAIS